MTISQKTMKNNLSTSTWLSDEVNKIMKNDNSSQRWSDFEKLSKSIVDIIWNLLEEKTEKSEELLLKIANDIIKSPQENLLSAQIGEKLQNLGFHEKENKELKNSFFTIMTKTTSGFNFTKSSLYQMTNFFTKASISINQILNSLTLPDEELTNLAKKIAYSDDSRFFPVKMLSSSTDNKLRDEDSKAKIDLIIDVLSDKDIYPFSKFIQSLVKFRGIRQKEYMLSTDYKNKNEGVSAKLEDFSPLIIKQMLISLSFLSTKSFIDFVQDLKASGEFQNDSWLKVEESLKLKTSKITNNQDGECWQALFSILEKEKLNEKINFVNDKKKEFGISIPKMRI